MNEYHLGFVIEQALGHITHRQNLASVVADDPEVMPTWLSVPYHAPDAWGRLPLIGRNLSMTLSLRARGMVRALGADRAPDGLFFHTQILSLFSLDLMRRIPTLISLDATPHSKWSAGFQAVDSQAPGDRIGTLKNLWYRQALGRASALTTWNRWTAESLERDYGLDPSRIKVIPPGVDLAMWRPVDRPPLDGRRARLLFVGSNFERKGGRVLLDALRSGLADRCELTIATGAGNVPDRPGDGVRVVEGLSPNSTALRQLYAEADLFVLPTLQDCMPIAIIEAMASGLPIVSTRIGAIGEEVEHGRNGLLVSPGDVGALIGAVNGFLDDPARLRSAALGSRDRAERLFDGDVNYRSLIALMKRCVDGGVSRNGVSRGADLALRRG